MGKPFKVTFGSLERRPDGYDRSFTTHTTPPVTGVLSSGASDGLTVRLNRDPQAIDVEFPDATMEDMQRLTKAKGLVATAIHSANNSGYEQSAA